MKPEIDEAAVWQRVTAAREEPQPEQTSPMKGAMLTAIQTGTQLEKSYMALYRSGKKQFQHLLTAQRQENRQLRGLFVQLFDGTPPAPIRENGGNRNCEALLRRSLILQQQQQEALVALAEQAAGLPRQLFGLLSEAAAQRWALLLEELGRIS